MSDKTRKKRDRRTLLLIELDPKVELAVTMGIMAVLIGVVAVFNVPNPNMILIAGLVVTSALFGYNGGIAAAVIMFLYTLFFFSTDNSFIHFTSQNAQKVVVSLIGILADMFFVCELKRNEMLAYDEIHKLSEELNEDNIKLQEASCIDALTGIRNRYALRNDYSSYIHKKVFVMILDIDNFKMINDTCGHDMGDRFLAETGRLLSGMFGRDYCYRYGGDEFLVIASREDDASFRDKVNRLVQNEPRLEKDGREVQISYSIGYTHGIVQGNEDLRHMFVDADGNMYSAKHEGKNTVVGE